MSVGGKEQICVLGEGRSVGCWSFTWGRHEQGPRGKQIAVSTGENHACALNAGGAVTCALTYYSAAEEPAWLRDPPPAAPATGSGGLLDRRAGASRAGVAAVAALGAAVFSLVILAALRRLRSWP